MKDPISQLRSATRRAKSDVANKLISMFLHELSRKLCRDWQVRIENEAYAILVRGQFKEKCPYCCRDLGAANSIIEHMDGMNRYRAGLHVPGNVLIACKQCNSEKRRDDSRLTLTLANSGWESFLSHDGIRCSDDCGTCRYWASLWVDQGKRTEHLAQRRSTIRAFRDQFPEFQKAHIALMSELPGLLTKLYSDCQVFAESEIRSLLERF